MLCTFTPNKCYAYLLNVEPSNLLLWKTYNTDFDEIIIVFTDQNGRTSKIEGQVEKNGALFYRIKSKKIC